MILVPGKQRKEVQQYAYQDILYLIGRTERKQGSHGCGAGDDRECDRHNRRHAHIQVTMFENVHGPKSFRAPIKKG
jgi:hypothetical protein